MSEVNVQYIIIQGFSRSIIMKKQWEKKSLLLQRKLNTTKLLIVLSQKNDKK